jgi:hypothetical protein
MCELDDAMEQHMAYLVLSLGRPFSFKDFLCFEVDGKEYRMSHGTIRNKFLAFRKKGIIEPDCNSGIAFYTLKGHRFGKPMTPYPAGVTITHNHPMYKILEGLVLDKASFHNVHLAFTLPKVYSIFSNTDLPRVERSEQIIIPWWKKNSVTVRTVISKTDTVSVTVACSSQPFPLEFIGFGHFSSILGSIEGRLEANLDMLMINHQEKINQIPDCGKWFITQWHLNRDALQEYTGKGFSITFETAQHIIYRIYAKQLAKHKHIRMEKQNYPRKTVEELEELIDGKLNFS